MRKTKFKKALLLLLSIALIAVMALFVGCSSNNTPEETEPPVSSTQAVQGEVEVLGEGSTEFALTVSDLNGTEKAFKIKTDKKTVGEALLDVKLIDGEQSDYGLYIKTVNGVTLDYDTDGAYWAFYIDGEYAMTGVDSTDINEACIYALKAEKA